MNSRQSLEHRVVMLRAQGMSKRAIARSLRMGRNRVNRILAKHETSRQSEHSALPSRPQREPRPSKLDPYRADIETLLRDYPDITAQRILEEISAKGYEGGYSIVKDLVSTMRPKPAAKISLPTPTYGPGEMAESDWAEYRISFTQAPQRKIYVFGYFLNYSRRKCYSLHKSTDLHALMDGHRLAFSRIEGVAHCCKYDNQKTVVLRREGNQPIYNPRFIDFATYYRFTPQACRPRRPNDKPGVERSFWELERSFLNGRTFRDLADMKEQLRWWMDNVCDQRLHRTLGTTAAARFADEKPHLEPLPAHPYDTARVAYRVCNVEGCVSWESNRYEVPYRHAADILPVRITASELYVYDASLNCIAVHPRLEKGAHQRARLASRQAPKSKPRGMTLDQLKQAYECIGAAEYLTGLIETHRSAAYHARKILALRDQYSTDDLASALLHAHKYQAFDHQSVERILQSRAKPRRLDEYVAERTAQKLQSVLRESRTEPRSLEDYDTLPDERHSEQEPCRDPEKPNQPEPKPQQSPTTSGKLSES